MLKHTTKLRVRYKETDKMGVVYYSNHLVWFEIARTELFRKTGYSYRDIEEDVGLRLMVVEAYCRYLLPARYDDLLSIECSLSELGKSSMAFEYTVKRQKEILAKGRTVHVFTDSLGKPRAMPQNLKEALT